MSSESIRREHGAFFQAEGYEGLVPWEEFLASPPSRDDDYLVVRWDWHHEVNWLPDDELRTRFPGAELLRVVCLHNSTGDARVFEVIVTPGDEAAVRAWIAARWETLRAAWAPVATDESELPALRNTVKRLREALAMSERFRAAWHKYRGELCDLLSDRAESPLERAVIGRAPTGWGWIDRTARRELGPLWSGWQERAETAYEAIARICTAVGIESHMPELDADRIVARWNGLASPPSRAVIEKHHAEHGGHWLVSRVYDRRFGEVTRPMVLRMSIEAGESVEWLRATIPGCDYGYTLDDPWRSMPDASFTALDAAGHRCGCGQDT